MPFFKQWDEESRCLVYWHRGHEEGCGKFYLSCRLNLIPGCLSRERITVIPGQVISRWEPGSVPDREWNSNVTCHDLGQKGEKRRIVGNKVWCVLGRNNQPFVWASPATCYLQASPLRPVTTTRLYFYRLLPTLSMPSFNNNLTPTPITNGTMPAPNNSAINTNNMDHWRVAVLGDGGVGKTALAVQASCSHSAFMSSSSSI